MSPGIRWGGEAKRRPKARTNEEEGKVQSAFVSTVIGCIWRSMRLSLTSANSHLPRSRAAIATCSRVGQRSSPNFPRWPPSMISSPHETIWADCLAGRLRRMMHMAVVIGENEWDELTSDESERTNEQLERRNESLLPSTHLLCSAR